jgi:hypothetical protein
MNVKDLKRGTVVRALRDFDPRGANVQEGDMGVVYEESNFHEDNSGPMVRWLEVVEDEAGFPLHQVGPMGICNVYEGDVEFVCGNPPAGSVRGGA